MTADGRNFNAYKGNWRGLAGLAFVICEVAVEKLRINFYGNREFANLITGGSE
jgi:hypothetical protein